MRGGLRPRLRGSSAAGGWPPATDPGPDGGIGERVERAGQHHRRRLASGGGGPAHRRHREREVAAPAARALRSARAASELPAGAQWTSTSERAGSTRPRPARSAASAPTALRSAQRPAWDRQAAAWPGLGGIRPRRGGIRRSFGSDRPGPSGRISLPAERVKQVKRRGRRDCQHGYLPGRKRPARAARLPGRGHAAGEFRRRNRTRPRTWKPEDDLTGHGRLDDLGRLPGRVRARRPVRRPVRTGRSRTDAAAPRPSPSSTRELAPPQHESSAHRCKQLSAQIPWMTSMR